jgi:predicted NBD/HSP70 family sugar kinase
VGNEADLGGLAEHVRGAAAGIPDTLYVSGEVGIGGGVIAAGRPVSGWGGYAGEIGHMVVNPTGEQCGCGSVGCWETEVGEGALIRRAGGPPEGLRDRVVNEIISAATDGDPHALDAVREVGRWTGIGLGILVNVFNPRVIVLGGLFARLHPLIEETENEELRRRVTVALREELDVRAGRFGMDAPLVGAGELAFEELLARPDELPVVASRQRNRALHRSTTGASHQPAGPT